GAVDGVAAGERQVLEVGVGEDEADRALDRVDAAAGDLDDEIAAVVDDIGVVALAALQRVGAGAAVEDVGAVVADQVVGAGIAGGVERRRAGERHMLDAGEGGKVEVDGERRLHGVAAVGPGLADDVVGVVDDVGVVAGAAHQAVGAGAADQRIVAAAAREGVGRGGAGDPVGEGAAGEMHARAGGEAVGPGT